MQPDQCQLKAIYLTHNKIYDHKNDSALKIRGPTVIKYIIYTLLCLNYTLKRLRHFR